MFHSTAYTFTRAYYACDKACGSTQEILIILQRQQQGDERDWQGIDKKKSSLDISELSNVRGIRVLAL